MERVKTYFEDLRIITANILVLIKAIILGVLFSEIVFFSITIANAINKFILNIVLEKIIVSITICFLIAVAYSIMRGIIADSKRIIKSGRFDLLVALCFGVWISITWGGFLNDWYSTFVNSLAGQQLLILIIAPFLLGTSIVFGSIFTKTKKAQSAFIEDKELETSDDDMLNFKEKANRFAERVFNNGAPESFVFGVDAPWGIGKSTFINFCKEYWDNHCKGKTVVYKFSPLRYASSEKLLEIFTDGLIHAIQKDTFIPEIRPLISRYSRLLNEVRRFSIFGLNIPILTIDYTADDVFDDLSVVLQKFNRKVIIVVDDLDRMKFSEIKDILFVIRKSFVLPNVSYVLCYDTENIGILEAETPDTEKVSEFLEKFVNIKISLYLDREDLAKYVSDNIEKILPQKLVDPVLVRQAIGGLLDIFNSSAIYHQYLPFIGDVRKLKRLINTVMMFELESTDFKNTDFDKKDLIHLLLIYIHYPNVFRKIYDTETAGGRGFFSLIIPYEDGYDRPDDPRSTSSTPSTYRNSINYENYIKQFPENSHQRFLLDQVFNVNIRLKDSGIDNIPEDVRTSLACINGGWTNGRNLETYLNLIVKLSKPENSGQHRFYANWRDQIYSGAVNIEDALKDQKFNYENGEQPREKLWRVLVNNARDLNSDVASALINNLLNYRQEYSILEIEDIGLGFRHNINYFIVSLLNDAGWTDQSGKHSHNTKENIKEVAERIFGEGRHVGNGVLSKYSNSSSDVLGLNDLMSFRLFCSADRGGDIFDLSRALSYHGDENAPTEGDTREIAKEEMREISQEIFNIFKVQYIDKKINIFNKIQDIEQEQLVGQYNTYLQAKISEGVVQESYVEKKVVELKTRIASFIIYQLGNDIISHGVGCGFYDPKGKKDEHKIRGLINDYLFDICFNPDKPENVEYFIDYLFRNFAHAFASAREDGLSYVPSINEFTKVLDKDKLAGYWTKRRSDIKAMNLESKEKIIPLGNNHEASYKKYIPLIYEVLDNHADSYVKDDK